MAKKTKKYYWIKLKADFFRQKEIKKLRRIAGGDTYTIIYLKMLLLALKNDNKLYFEGVEDDFADELALELDEESDNVKMTLAFLQNQNLIEMINEDEYLLPQCESMTGSESESAERVRKHRLKKKEQKALHCNVSVTSGNKNVTTETELEKDKETELETELEKDIEIEQHIEKADDVVSIFFPQLDNKNIKAIVDTFNKTKRNIYYLIEKLLITYDSDNISNKTGYIIKALEENYPIRFESTLDKLILVWEDELSIQQDDLTIRKRLDYYKYKYTQEKLNRGE